MKRTNPQQYERYTTRLGKLIRRERKRLGLTQPQLAKLAGGSKNWIWSLENGTRKSCSILGVFALIDAMGLDMSDFFNELFNENKEAKK